MRSDVERCKAIQIGAAQIAQTRIKSYKSLPISWTDLHVWSKWLARFDSDGLAGLGFADLPSLERKGSLS